MAVMNETRELNGSENRRALLCVTAERVTGVELAYSRRNPGGGGAAGNPARLWDYPELSGEVDLSDDAHSWTRFRSCRWLFDDRGSGAGRERH